MVQAQQYTLCDSAQSIQAGVDVLSESPYLILDCEGKDLGVSGGALSLICIGTAGAEPIFVFDALALDQGGQATQCLWDLLNDAKKIKYMWDGRMDTVELLEMGVKLQGVMDLQIVEVASRSTYRHESDHQRLRRLSMRLPTNIVYDADRSAGLHLVLGMQGCLKAVGIKLEKDPEIIKMHKENKTELWLKRPLPEKLLQYAAHDIFMLAKLQQAFIGKGWFNFDNTVLLEQSRRYVQSIEARGRVEMDDMFRPGACLPMDVLTVPSKNMGKCVGCQRLLSDSCFQKKHKGSSVMQSPRCRLCNALTSRVDESDWQLV